MCFLHIWAHILLAQSIAAEVVAALDVDVEALGGRRDIVMPTLEKVRELLEGSTEAPPTPSSLRTIGRSKLGVRPRLQSGFISLSLQLQWSAGAAGRQRR